MSSLGIDASLALLRQELDGMQKQDKALYSQLLTLQESIRHLKSELKREREECEEAFQDLEEYSRVEFQDDVFLEQNSNENPNEKDGNAVSVQKTWKHDRQDSGISVKTPEAESQDFVTTIPKSKHYQQEFDFVKSPTCSENVKSEVIPDYKVDLNANVQTTNVELRQKKTFSSNPGLIQHSKQDSGILIDEDAVKDTKLLSKLVESSEMLEKLENRKFDRIIQSKWMKARENSFKNRGFMVHHQRSRSSNEILKSQPQRSLQHQFSTGSLQPKHSHSNSCPQEIIKQLSLQGKERKVEDLPSKKLIELEKIKKQNVCPSHSRTHSFSSIRRITVANNVKQQIQLSNDVERTIKPKKKFETSDEGLAENNQRAFTPTLSTLIAGNAGHVWKSVSKQNFIPKHQHTRSLPATTIRDLIVGESFLSRQENRQSMQNISESKVVTLKQVRPRKRSASFVDLNSSGEGVEAGVKFESLAPRKASIVEVDGMKDVKGTALDKVSPELEEKVFNGYQGHDDIQSDDLKEMEESDLSRGEERSTGLYSPKPHKALVTQVDSFNVFNQIKNNLNLKQGKEGNENSIVHKTSVVQVNSLPRNIVPRQNKTGESSVSVKVNEREDNLTKHQVNVVEELEAPKPLRAVRVSATEINVSNVTDKQTLSRRRSLDERGSGNSRSHDGPQRRFTLDFKPNGLSPRLQPENGKLSPKFLSPKNHLRHHTTPEYDVIRRRHSLYTFHAPSKSWDGYSNRKPSEAKGIVRSISQVSLV